MEDHYKQEALRSEKRRLETEVSVPTGEIPDLRFQLDSRNSRLEEDEEFLKLFWNVSTEFFSREPSMAKPSLYLEILRR